MATVIYDGDCGICTRIRRAVERLDWLRVLRWVPQQAVEAAAFGIPAEDLQQRLYVAAGARRWGGFAGVKQMALRVPLFWMVVGASALVSPWLLLGWAVLFSPLAVPVGDRLYAWVARNRYRLPGSTCALPSREGERDAKALR